MNLENAIILLSDAEKIMKNAEELYKSFKEVMYEIRFSLEMMGEDVGMFSDDAIVSTKNVQDAVIKAERLLWGICNALTGYYRCGVTSAPKEDSKLISEPGTNPDELVSLWQEQDLVIVMTPHLRKRLRGTRAMMGCACVFESLKFKLHRIDRGLFHARQVYIYTLNVYSTKTPQYAVLDPDNINFKTIGDVVMNRLGIDDNGGNTSLIVHTVFSDALPPGTYTVVMPRNKDMLTGDALHEMIKNKVVEPSKTGEDKP